MRFIFCLALLVAGAPSALAAEPWPARTIRIVTATPAGGSPDFVSRLLAEKLGERLGQAVVVENSANTGVAAWNTVAKSPPDGHLICMLTGTFSARAAVAKSLPYDPIKDFTFVTLVSGYPMVVATAPDSPIQSFADLIAMARAEPGKLNWAGTTGALDFSFAGFLQSNNLNMTKVPYRNPVEAANDLAAGRVQVYESAYAIARPQLQAGKIKLLAVTNTARASAIPDVPTVAETLPGFAASGWFALVAPPGTPAAIVRKVSDDLRVVLTLPEVMQRFDALSVSTRSMSPQELSEFIRRERQLWKPVVLQANLGTQ